jgi:hypothetical protein
MDVRILAQKAVPPYSLYFPKMLSGTVVKSFPYDCPTADINLAVGNTSDGEGKFVTNIMTGDIIRVQTNPDMHNKSTLWKDVFSGVVTSISAGAEETGSGINIYAVDHGIELINRSIKTDYYIGDATTGEILTTILPELSRITDNSPSYIDTENSSFLESFNVKADTKHFIEVLSMLEKAEVNSYRFKTVPYYNADNILTAVYASWQPVPLIATEKYNIVKGTRSYHGSKFTFDASEMAKSVTVYGAQETIQRYGYIDGGVGDKDYIDTDTNIETNELCQTLAEAYFNLRQTPSLRGSATIDLTPTAEPGDLVYCSVPNMVLGDQRINADLRVTKVTHNFTDTGSYTTLDVGTLIPSYEDVLAAIMNKMSSLSANFIS